MHLFKQHTVPPGSPPIPLVTGPGLENLKGSISRGISNWSEWFGVHFNADAHESLVDMLLKLSNTYATNVGHEAETKGFREGYAARVGEEEMGYDPYEK
jgi:hypothetical protein